MAEYGRIHTDGSRSGGQPIQSDVERVARALAQADRIEICSDATYALSSYGHKAQAALAAMRQPTQSDALQADIDAMESILWVDTIIDDKEAIAKAFARHRQYGYDQGYYDGQRDRPPTQSDALLDGDAQTILYLLGVRHGREDERAKIAAEASQPTQSDALKVARLALQGMVLYSEMNECWQDDNHQYVEAADEAIDVIDAALEQSK